LFALLSSTRISDEKEINAYDKNETLINTYRFIQTNPIELYKIINSHIVSYDSITTTTIIRNPMNIEEANTSKESYYYYLRRIFNFLNNDDINKAALFVILNKLGFRGMYREGPNGFNIPFGNYKTTPHIFTREEIIRLSDFIKNVNFRCCNFTDSIQCAQIGDYVYLDPPYAPENTKSFVNYNQDGFNMDTHKDLFSKIHELHAKGVKFSMSNSNVLFVTDAFQNFNHEQVTARRAINSKKPNATTLEIIVYN
jgi:DNA adenine methylase